MTGHTGFKGGWLSLWLQRLGSVVSGYSLEPNTAPNLYASAGVGENMRSIFADVRHLECLTNAMAEAEPRIAFHLAAQPIVRESLKDPVGTYETNVMGTVNFLEAVRRTPSIRVAIIITSDKCYGTDNSSTAHTENDSMGGDEPYSSSKGCAELVTHAYYKSFLSRRSVSVATARAGNVIGGGDWAKDRLIPDLVRSFSKGRVLKIRYPEAIRPWQFVLEPLYGYMRLAERLWNFGNIYCGSWNFGPAMDNEASVKHLVEIAMSRWPNEANWEKIKTRKKESSVLKLDSQKAFNNLGWKTRFDLDDAIDWTLDWYCSYREGNIHMKDYSFNQIGKYEMLIDKYESK